MRELTLAIIKPNVTKDIVKLNGVMALLFAYRFQLEDIKQVYLTREQAEEFYAEHKGKDFFERLIKFMTSGECVFMVLEKENAIKDLRKAMNIIRGIYSNSFNENAIHGSDSVLSAIREIHFFHEKI